MLRVGCFIKLRIYPGINGYYDIIAYHSGNTAATTHLHVLTMPYCTCQSVFQPPCTIAKQA